MKFQVPICDAIESMVWVLGQSDTPLLLCSTIDEDGFVGPGNCFALDKGLPSNEVLMELPRRVSATALLFGSPARSSVIDPGREDIALTRRLISAGEEADIPLDEHVLVGGSKFRLMRQSIEEGLLPE